MSRPIRVLLALALLVLTTTVPVGCGGGGAKPADAVVEVGGQAITKPLLSHWMSTILGGDFYEITHRVAPTGLVSEPPNYSACIAGLERLAARLSHTPAPTAQLRRKCEQLHQAVKQQAIGYLIAADTAIGQDAEQGLTVSNSEAERYFRQRQNSEFPKEAELAGYLADRHWSLDDEMFLVKRDLLSARLLAKLKRKFTGAGGQAALIRYANEAAERWKAKTNCRPGYVVNGCKQYTAAQARATAAEASPAVLIEELA